MDPFSRKELRTLLTTDRSPCISLLMPTTRGVKHEDKSRWKNLVREAESRLTADGLRSSEAKELLKAAHDLVDEIPFWLNVSAGLAGFIAPGSFRAYRLPVPLKEEIIVGKRFHIAPLLPVLADNGRFYILALSQKHIRLLQGTRFTVQEMELREVPANITEALHYGGEVEMRTRNFHTHTAAGGPAGRREAIVHGQGVGVESAKDGLLDYFQQVDKGLHRYLHGEKAPLVLATAEFLMPIYREANSYPHLLESGVEGNPDRLSPQELHDRAWAIVQPSFHENQEKAAGQYRQLAGTGRTASDVAAVMAAAFQGQIQHLFVAGGQKLSGTFDPVTLKTEIHQSAQPGDEDLLNLAVWHALLHDGSVYCVEPAEVPSGTVLAGIFWLPLGERKGKRVIAATA